MFKYQNYSNKTIENVNFQVPIYTCLFLSLLTISSHKPENKIFFLSTSFFIESLTYMLLKKYIKCLNPISFHSTWVI